MTQARRDFLAQLGALAAIGSGTAAAGGASGSRGDGSMAVDALRFDRGVASRGGIEAAMAACAGALARAHGGHGPEPGDSALLDPRLNPLLPNHPDAWDRYAAQHDAVLAAALRHHIETRCRRARAGRHSFPSDG
jgi:hypothetical protein